MPEHTQSKCDHARPAVNFEPHAGTFTVKCADCGLAAQEVGEHRHAVARTFQFDDAVRIELCACWACRHVAKDGDGVTKTTKWRRP